MRSVFAAHPSPDDPLAALRLDDRPAPEVPDGHVAVNVRAASVNMHDIFTLQGVGIRPDQFPMILGMDGAGTLDDGSEVVIHSVVSSPGWHDDETLDPRRSCLSEQYQGTFAERVVVPSGNVLPKPPLLTYAEAACMGVAWLTAYRMLFTRSGLRPGATILVQGASGGVATALIQLASKSGFKVWVTGRTEEKRALASSLGANEVFEPGARLPARVDGVFDSVGKATWAHSIKALKPGGVIVTCGATTGDPEAAELHRIFYLQHRIVGSTMGTRSELEGLLAFCEGTGARPRIAAEVPLKDAEQAFRTILAGDTAGKIVLTL
ncbi:zinc-binding dehydrogenase [Rhodococcus sp. IEGM 1307]|uniref:zinc-binding dehydrogenase n=1 Tax=Rhodococcus sp. IEGM 1307 TaxID=3047091 RepID=UPI001063CC69|nr:zinc-binding dehydrogenase [Rhodococcus sp. IEGM 1307]MDI9977379.1 zinc-binding dehydrogenase [Rhodococcus sp. IEGM 1307]NDV04952.1 zinc-binding dehydrogenase [Rhodococcus sp. IEGM 248]WKN60646.1 zinc-binding dehydrogenase [Rhodococcus opacus]